MSEYTLVIPRWRPHTTNELLEAHFFEAAKFKKSDAKTIWAYAMKGKIHTALSQRIIKIHIKQKPGRGRLIDPDNVLKSTLDALKRCKLIVDDSSKWCLWERPIIERGTADDWGTTITLADVKAEKLS